MSKDTNQEVAYLRIEKPPEGWTPPTTIWFYLESAAKYMRIEVLGPPVPDALSPEAQAVLEAAEDPSRWIGDLGDAAKAYALSRRPPDPLREAREALADLQRLHYSGSRMFIINRLSAALDRLAEQGGAA